MIYREENRPLHMCSLMSFGRYPLCGHQGVSPLCPEVLCSFTFCPPGLRQPLVTLNRVFAQSAVLKGELVSRPLLLEEFVTP